MHHITAVGFCLLFNNGELRSFVLPILVASAVVFYLICSAFSIYSCHHIGVDDILAGFYVKDDGRVNPVDVTMALSKGTL
jgi:hypothetical protein